MIKKICLFLDFVRARSQKRKVIEQANLAMKKILQHEDVRHF